MGHTITREEERARHAFRRGLAKATREAAKGSGWKCNGGMIFRERNGWFFDAYPAVAIFWRQTQASMRVKPMAIDPIYWDLIDMRENGNQSLSFRALGAWTCQAPTLEETMIEEFDMSSQAAANAFVGWTIETSERLLDTLTLEGFSKLVDQAQRPGPFNPFFATKIATKILMGQIDEARQLSVDARRNGDAAAFIADESVPELALNWLDKQRASQVVH